MIYAAGQPLNNIPVMDCNNLDLLVNPVLLGLTLRQVVIFHDGHRDKRPD